MNAPFLRRTAATFAAALVLGGSSPVMAEDIDIFTSAAGGVAPPNLLVILDSSSNWSSTLGTNDCMGVSPYSANTNGNTMFAAEVCAFQKITETLPNDALRMGLMMISESGNNGGYMRFGMRNMNVQNKRAMHDMLAEFVQNGSDTDNSGSNQPYAKMMYEAFKYYGGYTCPAHSTDGVGACATSTNDQTHFGKTAFAGGPDNNTGSYPRDYVNHNASPDRGAAKDH